MIVRGRGSTAHPDPRHERRALRAEVRDLRKAFNVRLEVEGRALARTVNEENEFARRGTE